MSFVRCRICDKKLQVINGLHLKSHNVTLSDYTKMFPNASLMTAYAKDIRVRGGKINGAIQANNKNSILYTKTTNKAWIEAAAGRRGVKFSEEHRHKVSEGIKRHYSDSANRKKQSDRQKGKKLSEETKKKQSKRRLELFRSNPGLRDKYSKAAKKRNSSPEYKRRSSAWMRKAHAEGKFDHTYSKRVDGVKRMWTERKEELVECIRSSWTKEKRKQRSDRTKEAWENGQFDAKHFRSSLEDKIYKMFVENGLFPKRNSRSSVFRKPISRHPFDFMFKDLKIVVEVDGCYWHNCSEHYPDYHKEAKEKDNQINEAVRDAGWSIIRIWEHDIKKNDFLKLNKLFRRK